MKLSPEVALLQEVFPTVSPEALMNALSVSDNNVETAKQVQIHFLSESPLLLLHNLPCIALQLSSAAQSAAKTCISGLGKALPAVNCYARCFSAAQCF